MTIIEKNISNFIENQFPQIYREEGPIFVEFVKKYYEWMEQSNNTIYHSRRLLDYKDVDETVDDFVIYLKEKYLKQIQFETVTQTRQLIKNSLDLYRSKGTERSVDLFFRAIFGRPAEVYYPGEDIFKLSDGTWVKPTYLEVTPSPYNEVFVGKQIEGVTSGATAFVERYIRRKIQNKYVDILYISALSGNFSTGELLTLPGQSLKNIPTVIGSMTTLQVIIGGSGFSVGDIVDLQTVNGKQGKARVTSISDVTGIVEFTLLDSGWGYSTNSSILVSQKVLTIANCQPQPNTTNVFDVFEQIVQPLANVVYFNANNGLLLDVGSNVYSYYTNGSVCGSGRVLEVTQNTIVSSFNANTGVNNASDFITIVDNVLTNNKAVLYTTDEGNTALSGLTNNTLYYTVSANSSGVKLSSSKGGYAINITASSTDESGHKLTTYGGEAFVSEYTGNVSTVFEPNANLAGTVSVFAFSVQTTSGVNQINTTSNVVTGTSTSFTTDFVVGSIIKLFAYNSNNVLLGTDTKRVTSITNNTLMALDSNNSFVSNNVIIQTIGDRAVVGSGTSFNTDFVYGDTVAIFSNSTSYVLKTVNSVVNSTYMTTQEPIGFSNTSASYANTLSNSLLYSESNATVFEVSTYTSKRASANIIGTSTNAVLYVANSTGIIQNTFSVYQISGSTEIANAKIRTIVGLTGTTSTLNCVEFNGAFQPSSNVYFRYSNGLSTGITGVLNSYDITVGVVSINNAFTADQYNFVYGSGSSTTGTISRVSSGSLANFSVANTFQYPESITIYTDPIAPYANIALNSPSFGFPRYPSANVSTQYLVDIFSNNTLTIGGISTLVGINPGINYDTAPFVLLLDPIIAPFNRRDYTFEISNATLAFVDGEVIQQTNGAKGIVKTTSNNSIGVKRIQFNNVFDTSLAITGLVSGASANIVSISSDDVDLQIGLNAVVQANVQTSVGSVTGLSVYDSGFGYLDKENAQFVSSDGSRSGTARVLLGKQGSSEGFYRNKKGFVSDTKFIYDGEYYQDYSYEVRTSVTADKYAEMLKNIIHVAGTKTFYSTVLSSTSSMQTNITTDITTE